MTTKVASGSAASSTTCHTNILALSFCITEYISFTNACFQCLLELKTLQLVCRIKLNTSIYIILFSHQSNDVKNMQCWNLVITTIVITRRENAEKGCRAVLDIKQE